MAAKNFTVTVQKATPTRDASTGTVTYSTTNRTADTRQSTYTPGHKTADVYTPATRIDIAISQTMPNKQIAHEDTTLGSDYFTHTTPKTVTQRTTVDEDGVAKMVDANATAVTTSETKAGRHMFDFA